MRKKILVNAPSRDNMQWHIQMLGGLQVTNPDRTHIIQNFRTRRAALLLARLAVTPGKAYSRDELGEMLWPEAEPQIQRTRLRYQLSTLRSTFEVDIFSDASNHNTIALLSTITSDVSEFEKTLRRAELSKATEQRRNLLEYANELYKGDFLPGFSLPEGTAPEYDWISLIRQRLQDTAYEVNVRLINELSFLGVYDAARSLHRETAQQFPTYLLPDFPHSGTKNASSVELPMAPQGAALGSAFPMPLLNGKFFGRTKELKIIQTFIGVDIDSDGSYRREPASDLSRKPQSRLLFVIGTGGIGKTRLVLEFARDQTAFVFVDLTEVFQADYIYEAIHKALLLPRRNGVTLRDHVLQALSFRIPCILCLDNFEQLTQDGMTVVHDMLSHCLKLRIIVTSRRRIKVPAAKTLTIKPLPVTVARELLVNRAQAVQVNFAPTPQLQSVAYEVAELVEGIPLALELVAARAVVLTVSQIQNQLTHKLRFLQSNHPHRPSRHRSMRAVLKWSVDLLSPNAQRLLYHLSVFRAAASLSAVEQVAVGVSDLLNALEELRLHSLISLEFKTENETQEARYNLLSIIREYAAEQLTPYELSAAWERHAAYWVERVEPIRELFNSGDWKVMQSILRNDLNNIRSAIAGCITGRFAASLYALTNSLGAVFLELGYWEDADLLLRELSTSHLSQDLSTGQTIRLLGLRGALARRRGDETTAREVWNRRLVLARQDGNSELEITIRYDLAGQMIDVGDLSQAADMVRAATDMALRERRSDLIIIGRMLMARRALSLMDNRAMDHWGNLIWENLAEAKLKPVQILYVVIHLMPIYRVLGYVARAVTLIKIGFPLAMQSRQAFLMARLSGEIGQLCESSDFVTVAATALHLSKKIHSELRSRLQEESEQLWNLFMALHPEIATAEVVAASNVTIAETPSWYGDAQRLQKMLTLLQPALVRAI